jgi:hypothetical protein
MRSEIARIPNLGPKSESWLNASGIFTRKDLDTIGSVEAFILVESHGYNPSLNLLWEIADALLDMP